MAAVRTRPETYHEDLRRAWRLAGADGRQPGSAPERPVLVTLAGGRVPGPGAVVAPWTLDAVLAILREIGATNAPVVLGDALSVRSAERTGLTRVCGQREVALEGIRAEPSTEVGDVEVPWLRGLRGGVVQVDERLPGRPACVVAPLRRCHRLGLRGAVDAAIAAVAAGRERRGSDVEAWADLLHLRRSLHPSIVFVLDATVCGTEEGDARPALHDLVIVGRDPVACDVLAARLLGLAPERLVWLRRAADRTRTPLQLGALGLRGESLGERDLEVVSGPAAMPRAGEGRFAPLRDRLDPVRWARPWRRRRWGALYERSPWGRLHAVYRAPGGTPFPGPRQERP